MAGSPASRSRSVEGLHSLFGRATGFDELITTEDFTLRLDGSSKQ